MPALPPCPHLPAHSPGMSWRDLHRFDEVRDGAFYETALRYAQDLWLRGLAARALLAVDRALFADLRGDEAILKTFPLPYAAVPWIIKHTPAGVFIGNPRVHYQHLADRVRGPRTAIKKWRAWACWALVRQSFPDLPGDPRHAVEEPDLNALRQALRLHGIPGEDTLWSNLQFGASKTHPNQPTGVKDGHQTA